MKDKLGVIHGRFQLLHNDHMKYLLAGKERCEHLIIGICNPEQDLTKYTSNNPHRSKKVQIHLPILKEWNVSNIL